MMARFFCLVVRCYKAIISPYLPPACRFFPSCSEYSHDAFHHFGWKKGIWLTAARIIRCHPFAKAGFDPLPHFTKEHCHKR